MSSHPVGYLSLLRTNTPFRRLWYGQIVSQLGDWFDSIALYALLPRLTGSEQSVGLLLLAQFIPTAIAGPLAGVIVDRLPRKLAMIGSDIGRALLVLALLFIHDPSQVWMIYSIVVLKFTFSAFFDPARSAILPALVKREELVAANTISSATWSAMLAVGAALGGVVAGVFGTDVAFAIDAASFALSAVLIASVRVRETHMDTPTQTNHLQDLRAGVAYLAHDRDALVLTICKALWSLGGGILVVLTIFGRGVFPMGEGGALSIGLLYAARGVGAGIGPVIIGALGDQSERFMRRMMGLCFLISALGYALLPAAPVLALAALAVMLAHCGGGTQWVYGTALLQLRLPDAIQGRIFAIELALLTLTSGVSSYGTSLLADMGWSPASLSLLMAALFALPGLWLWRRLGR
ncbi:MFS transporter [Chloroflexia bacterium SDU3-3]|nr:MFS transporter [Chloroflexia bacterium SDU3-3]